MRSWIRDELGPEAAIADRLREDGATLLRIPELVRRMEAQFPARGGAPEPPPLPHVELVWERRARQGRGWFGYVVAALLGGALVMGSGLERLVGLKCWGTWLCRSLKLKRRLRNRLLTSKR